MERFRRNAQDVEAFSAGDIISRARGREPRGGQAGAMERVGQRAHVGVATGLVEAVVALGFEVPAKAQRDARGAKAP